MVKKIFVVLVVGMILVGFAGGSFAMCGMCEAKAAESAVKVNNKICPVTKEPVDMKNPVTYEHKGKVYNLCCEACVGAFEKDPQKYIKIVDKELSKEAR